MHGLGASSHLTARFVSLIRAAYLCSLILGAPIFDPVFGEGGGGGEKNARARCHLVMFWFFRFFLWLEFG